MMHIWKGIQPTGLALCCITIAMHCLFHNGQLSQRVGIKSWAMLIPLSTRVCACVYLWSSWWLVSWRRRVCCWRRCRSLRSWSVRWHGVPRRRSGTRLCFYYWSTKQRQRRQPPQPFSHPARWNPPNPQTSTSSGCAAACWTRRRR